jgi:hypothetical protein
MHRYFQETYGWQNKTVESIWVEVHGKALPQLSCGEKVTTQKYIHQQITCNKRENRYTTYKSPMCHECNQIIECTDQFFSAKVIKVG